MITLGDAVLWLRAKDAGLNKGLTDAEKKVKGFAGSLGKAVQGLTGFNIAGLGAAGVAVGIARGVGKAINELIDYNKSMSDSAGATGMAVEQLSRLVQTADDVGIAMASVTGTLQLATKNGFAPTIDSIADLADKTNAMTSPTERAAYLAGILGRGWAGLNPLLKLGGQRIREMTAAQADGLVVTEEEIAKTERLRTKVDELNDRWTAWKNNVSLAISTVFVDELDSMDRARAATDKRRAAAVRLLEEGIKPTPAAVSNMVAQMEREKVAVDAAAGSTEQMAQKSEDLLAALANLQPYLDNKITIATYGLSGAVTGAERLLGYLQELTNRQWGVMVNGTYVGPDVPGGGGGGGGGSNYGPGTAYPTGVNQGGYIWVRGQNTGIPAKKAAGGPVQADRPYIVGEEGPETFVPRQAGTIVPHGESPGGITVNINNPVIGSQQDLDVFMSSLKQVLRR